MIPLQSKETLYAILVTGLHGWGLFSNSFIEAEKKVVLFFVTTSVIVLIVSTFKNIKKTVVTFAGWQKRPETQTLSKLLVYAMAIKLSNYSTAGNYEPFEMDASVFLWECALPLIAVPVVLVGVMAAHPHDRSDTKKFLFAEITLTGNDHFSNSCNSNLIKFQLNFEEFLNFKIFLQQGSIGRYKS